MNRKIIIAGNLDTIEYYPTHICVPLPQGEVANGDGSLLADGAPVMSQIDTVMHWPDRSAKVQHVWAKLKAGVNYEYSNEVHEFVGRMQIVENSQRIEVDNGLIQVIIDKYPNAGYIQIRTQQELLASSTHFAIDDRMLSFSVQNALHATVEIEHRGEIMVCIKISGWYETKEKRVPGFILGTTRVYIFENSPVIKFDHASIFGANMNLHGIAQMGIDFKLARPFALQLVGKYTNNEKFPYYITQTDNNAIFWQWPGSNRIDNNDESEIAIHNLYKNLWLHNGPLLDPRLPNRYFEAWRTQTDTKEIKPEYARAANMQGIAMRCQFGIIAGSGFPMPYMKLYKDNPIGIVEPSEAARSNVFGPIAPYVDHESPEIAAVDEWVNKAAKGNFGSIARYGDYGVFNFGNLHSDEFMSQGRPSLHRCYSNNHYGFNSILWMLFFRSGDYSLLRWIRIANDYYASIGQVKYDELKGKPDGTPGPETKHHWPGAFWHCKGGVPFGGRDYGMDANDIDADFIGHWPDPTSLLYAYIIDACDFSREAYELWADNVKFRSDGWAREVNTSIVHAIYLYEY